MNLLKTVYIAALIIIGFQTNIHAVEPVLIDNSLNIKNISRYMAYAVLPPEHDPTIHEMTDPLIEWKGLTSVNLTVPDTRQKHWFRFSVINTGETTMEWFLKLDYALINFIDLYQQNDDGTYDVKKTGFLLPKNIQEVQERCYVFRIKQPPGKQTFYLRVEDSEPLNCNITLMSSTGYSNHLKKELAFFYFFYGLMGAMIVYNLFIFFSVRERSHFYYVVFIFAITLFCFSYNGFGTLYIWQNNVFMGVSSTIIAWALLPGFAWIFIIAHDDIKHKSLLFYKTGIFCILVPSFINALISLYTTKLGLNEPELFVPLLLYLSIVSALAVIFIMAYLLYSSFVLKSRTARNLLISCLCVFVFIPITLMNQRAIVPGYFLVRHAYQIGFAAMTLLLSFGMADKINIMKNELKTKLDAQLALEQSRQKLRHTEEQYRNIFENALEGIFQATHKTRSGHEGYFINANPAMIRTMGYESLQDLNRSITSFSKDFFLDSTEKNNIFNVIAQKGQVIGIETKLKRKDGSLFWAEMSARDVRDENDNHLYYEGTLVDITDRRKREEMEKNYESAKAASIAKSEFLAGMSHEIRTPMNAIVGFTNLTLQTQLTSKQYDYLSKIKMSGESLIGIINDILDFSKIEAGKLNLESVSFNLMDIMNHVVDLFTGKAAEKRTKIAVSIGKDVPCELTGDPLRLRQILINLTGNAVKFTDNGEVGIDISLEKKYPGHTRLKFMVTDTGIGLSEEQLSAIFDAYTQADLSISRKFGGTGLGLSISKRLVELMNGKIWAESIPEKGSRFLFTAEFKQQPGVTTSPSEECRAPERKKIEQVTMQHALAKLHDKRVLVVDDNDINRQVAEEILTHAGLIVHTVKNGRQAIEAATSHKFDIILMDIEMPVMNGHEATHLIRNTLFLRDLPIIAMTAHAIQGYREECLRSGMNDYITKPIDNKELFLTLSRHIPGKNKAEKPADQYRDDNTDHALNLSNLYHNTAEIDIDGALGRMDGDRNLLLKVLSMFAMDYSDAHNEIKEKLKNGDMEAAKQRAHSVKGAASNFGAEELCIVAEKLVNEIEKGDRDNFNHLVSDFEIKLQRVLTAIQRIEK